MTASYSAVGGMAASNVDVKVTNPDMRDLLADLAGLINTPIPTDPPIVNVSPAQVNVYPQVDLPTINLPKLEAPAVNVEVAAPHVTVTPQIHPIVSVSIEIPKAYLVTGISGIYLLLFTMIFLILSIYFPPLIELF